jgi:hypothetical protein
MHDTMKTTSSLAILLFAMAGLFDRSSAQTNAPTGPPMSLTDQEKAAWQERVDRLERLGEVPENADRFDWQAAQETSWWGKPLDPEKFWKGRVVWLDDSAVSAAARHGRAYPPIPYDDPTLPHYKNDETDIVEESGGVEELRLMVHLTNREGAFWDKFSKTHPTPPEDLEREQSTIGFVFRDKQFDALKSQDITEMPTEKLSHREQLKREAWRNQVLREVRLGYPPEALTQGALFWAYVLKQRREYQELFKSMHGTNNASAASLLARLTIDPKYVTDPLPDGAVQKANAWKIAYLQRLSKENVDQSYINAYLKAWNLQRADVFTSVSTPANQNSP